MLNRDASSTTLTGRLAAIAAAATLAIAVLSSTSVAPAVATAVDCSLKTAAVQAQEERVFQHARAAKDATAKAEVDLHAAAYWNATEALDWTKEALKRCEAAGAAR